MNFDGEDKRWDEYYKREWNDKRKPLPIEKIIKKAVPKQNAGLYVGLGTGRNVFPLLKEGWNVYACDIAHTSIKNAKENYPQYATHFDYGSYTEAFPHIKAFDYTICSEVLVNGNFPNVVERFRLLKDRLTKEGFLIFELPAIGTDIWPNWKSLSMSKNGSLKLKYRADVPNKLYLSFQDICHLLENAGFKIVYGPKPVNSERSRYPGGLIRDWLGIAQNVSLT
ncbi:MULTISPECIES: class I SAM-dependent methyltransferase [Lacticaseibacillus]|jgi:hypothetical protein|uniref:Methyltransferase domain-containing protein n=4 Tax=Lacticaseibacillus TaxID=2759736 RepID=A0AAN1C5S3_LACCA|nr:MULTISPECIES: methyltransferase domain-containing protein [Lacticaseibacillus]ARY90319.1 hypothetical protein BGL52_00515 [Lacticaseibacillus casei]KAB1969938.1 class I SAM-dependent methyltransferase [Lacticaseibacillus casei]MDE3281234.1 class I SAM-dependent methyltransferase [Lacticaseibacillus casei]MDG3062133.1 methyltransferase domain-containing protein [Lacticaseibacillus sp. BCRC 81376]QVI36326.1 methyltransferase domain-containing protein [Lacticaseibacillus casei]